MDVITKAKTLADEKHAIFIFPMQVLAQSVCIQNNTYIWEPSYHTLSPLKTMSLLEVFFLLFTCFKKLSTDVHTSSLPLFVNTFITHISVIKWSGYFFLLFFFQPSLENSTYATKAVKWTHGQ